MLLLCLTGIRGENNQKRALTLNLRYFVQGALYSID